MYYSEEFENICYETEHIDKVLKEIKNNFQKYFKEFIETEKGNSPSEIDISALSEKFKITEKSKPKKIDKKANFERIINEEIESFEKHRKKYLDILDTETLEEYKTDTGFFKDTILRNQCPIIHHTLQNKKAKELDKYRIAFKNADPTNLLKIVTNITEFANKYVKEVKPDIDIFNINSVNDLKFEDLENDEYIVYGVIGGGIKSHFFFKLYPDTFPYRSREAIWALWYLSAKKKFGCKQDSEFLMINLKDNSTQQNYFYPYHLFAFYAVNILKMIKIEIYKINANFDSKYRFVVLDAFLSFVAQKHDSEIKDLKQKVKEDGYF